MPCYWFTELSGAITLEMFKSPGIFPLKSMTYTKMMGRRKHLVFARKQGLEQDFIMISNTRTYLYFTFKRTDFDNYTLWLCSIHSSAKLDYHRLELQYLKAARTVYSVGSEPESPLRQFFRSIWTLVLVGTVVLGTLQTHRNNLIIQYEEHYGVSLLNEGALKSDSRAESEAGRAH